MSISTGPMRQSARTVDELTARSFVPRFLLSRLAGDPILGPEHHSVRRALLLSDIEGFTAHVERLAQHGREGLEEVITGFNRYFAALVPAVYRYDGDILTIAGDSALCWWPAGEAEDLNRATALAAQAALAVHEAVAEEAVALPTRIGIAAGAATITIAGGVQGRWELLPSGPAVADVVACERDARPGVVLLSAASARALAGGAHCREAGEGRFELLALTAAAPGAPSALAAGSSPEIEIEQIEPLVPAPVLRWGAADHTWLADFRHVTAVMVKLSSAVPAGDEGFERQQSVIAGFQRIAARFDAASKVQFESKGITCSAVFGLPPRAHHDDVDRGLRAAGAVRRCDNQLNAPRYPSMFPPVRLRDAATGTVGALVDGGIVSGFPVFLFDCPQPNHPTLGLSRARGHRAPLPGHRRAALANHDGPGDPDPRGGRPPIPSPGRREARAVASRSHGGQLLLRLRAQTAEHLRADTSHGDAGGVRVTSSGFGSKKRNALRRPKGGAEGN